VDRAGWPQGDTLQLLCLQRQVYVAAHELWQLAASRSAASKRLRAMRSRSASFCAEQDAMWTSQDDATRSCSLYHMPWDDTPAGDAALFVDALRTLCGVLCGQAESACAHMM
jgi:hypothetical protein